MSRNLIDKSQDTATDRASRYLRLDRIKAGEAMHPGIRMLDRRRRRGINDASRVKHFLRIERGYLA